MSFWKTHISIPLCDAIADGWLNAEVLYQFSDILSDELYVHFENLIVLQYLKSTVEKYLFRLWGQVQPGEKCI